MQILLCDIHIPLPIILVIDFVAKQFMIGIKQILIFFFLREITFNLQ